MASAEQFLELQGKIQAEMDKMRTAQAELKQAMSAREKLEAQLHENQLVKEDLDDVEPGLKVFKKTGGVLIEQDIVEAKANVSTRIDYITTEMKRNENVLKQHETAVAKIRETVQDLSKQLQQSQGKVAAGPTAVKGS